MRTKIIILTLVFLLTPSLGMASTLYFSPEAGELGPGNEIAIDVLLDAEACINAVEADIAFSYQHMKLKDFFSGESIFTLWVEKPGAEDIATANESGILNIIGGTPGGYCGRIPGDPGVSNKIATLIFEVPNINQAVAGETKLKLNFLPSTRALLNDGLGTSADLTTKTADFSYVEEAVEIKDEWSNRLNNDIIAPEPFIVELRQDPRMFDGRYYIIFNTADKQSGIDHYEVLEIRPDEELGVVKGLTLLEKIMGQEINAPKWEKAQMPYLLKDQELLSIIKVKAVDKAGNERFVEYIPPESKRIQSQKANTLNTYVLATIVLVLGLIFVLLAIFVRKIILNKKHDQE